MWGEWHAGFRVQSSHCRCRFVDCHRPFAAESKISLIISLTGWFTSPSKGDDIRLVVYFRVLDRWLAKLCAEAIEAVHRYGCGLKESAADAISVFFHLRWLQCLAERKRRHLQNARRPWCCEENRHQVSRSKLGLEAYQISPFRFLFPCTPLTTSLPLPPSTLFLQTTIMRMEK